MSKRPLSFTQAFARAVPAVTLLLLACLFAWLPASAQTRAHNRIAAIDENRLAPLPGHVHPLAQPRDDRGSADTTMVLHRMVMVFSRTPQQESELDALLQQQQDSGSPQYHRWLTPEQFGDRFGVTATDQARAVAWLQGHGFTLLEAGRSRTYVAFQGPVAQVEAAFHTAIHRYQVRGQIHFANATAPILPAALAGVVLGVRGLHDFRPEPRGIVRPRFTSNISGNHFLVPDDFATIYNLKPLYGAGINGTGQSIAVAGQTDISQADINAFRSNSGLPATTVQVVLTPGPDPGVSAGDIDEAHLDLEWSGAVAPNAHLIFVNSFAGVFDSAAYAVDQNLAPVLSISYGFCEAGFGTVDLIAFSDKAKQANAQGITISVAAGDTGATDCDFNSFPAQFGLAVDAPGSLPYVTAVGGTRFNDGTGGTYWSASNNSGNGSALSYIPEVAWNDTLADGSFASGGGGKSGFFGKPVWQAGPGVPNDNARDVPDVAFAASVDHDGYLICSQGTCANGFRDTDNSLNVVGGTSAGAPAFAGMVALLNQKLQARQGNVNPRLYQLAAGGGSVFHDITTGNNSQPCSAGTTNCPSGGSIGYSAGPGYDQATGLGSVDANALATAFASVSPSISTLSPESATAGGAAFTLTVNGANFASGANVQWNSSARPTTFVSATQLQASITAADIAGAASASVTVLNPGNGGASNVLNFIVTSAANPLLASISPGTAVAGGAAFTLTLTGTGFAANSAVQWNGSARATTLVSGTQLTAAITAADIAAPGAFAVTVVNGAVASNAANFFVVASAGALPLAQSRYLPHIVDGGGFVTKITATNLATNANQVMVEFLSLSGVPAKTVSAILPAGGTLRIATPESNRANPNATIEWAIVNSSDTVGTNLFFELADGNGAVTNTIGFNDQAPLTDMTIPVELQATPPPGAPVGRTIGVAIVNPSSTTAANVTMTLVDSNGNTLATAPVSLAPLAHFQADVSGIAQFAAVLPKTNFIGAITFSSNIPVVLLALEDDLGPFSALPPMAGRSK